MIERIVFVGGPWDGETREMQWSPRIDVGGGCYVTVPTERGDLHRMMWSGPMADDAIANFLKAEAPDAE